MGLFDRQQKILFCLCSPHRILVKDGRHVLDVVTVDWQRAKQAMSIPSNCNYFELFVDGLEVGQARCEVARRCLDHNPRPEFCFTARTFVETENGPKRITDIQVGDVVRTHLGRLRRVTYKFKTPYPQRSPLVWVHSSNGDIRCTPNHPFFVVRPGKTEGEFIRANCLCPGDEMLYPDKPQTDSVYFGIRFNSVGINRDGKLGSVKNGRNLDSVIVTPDLARFLGLFLAEGCGGEAGVTFTFGNHETKLIQFIKRISESIFGRTPGIHSRWATIVRINIRSLGRLFRGWFGSNAREKRIPPFVFSWSLQNRLHFIKGFLEGDGSRIQRASTWAFRTASQQLANDVLKLSKSCQLHATYTTVKPGVAVLQRGSTIVSNWSYQGYFSRPSSEKMADLINARRHGDYLCIPITKVIRHSMTRHKNREDQYVYNLEVEEDNSYVAGGSAVHNCFFLDDDVIVPQDALVKLFFRARTLPQYDVYAGVYCLKRPGLPEPLIYGEHGQGPLWDWTVGDILTTEGQGVRSVHMGLSLVRISSFQKIIDAGLVHGDGTDPDDEPFFRTISETKRNGDGTCWRHEGTEDIYFCDKLMKAGGHILVDTSVLGAHQDKASGIKYGLPLDKGPAARAKWLPNADKSSADRNEVAVWVGCDCATVVPTRSISIDNQVWSDELTWSENGPVVYDKECQKCHGTGRVKSPPKLALDLGAGNTRREWPGYKTYTLDADPGSGADYIQDLRLLNIPDDHFDLVASSHAFEHIPRWEQEDVWRETFRVCRPGGKLEITVPNVEWAAAKIMEGDIDEHVMNVLYGSQEAAGIDRLLNLHYFGYTPDVGKALAEAAGFINVTTECYKQDASLGYHLIVRGEKPVKEVINGEQVNGRANSGTPDGVEHRPEGPGLCALHHGGGRAIPDCDSLDDISAALGR